MKTKTNFAVTGQTGPAALTLNRAAPTSDKKAVAAPDQFALSDKKAAGLSELTTLPLAASANSLLDGLASKATEVEQLYNLRPTAQIYSELTERKYPRAELVSLLKSQNGARNAGAAVMSNIDKLEDPNTVTVVTGQQVGLLGGPLYSLFKALGAIKQAQELSDKGMSAVPVFWLASYDHDLPEVNQVPLLTGGQEPDTVRLPHKPGQRPVGDIKLGDGVQALLDSVENALGDAPHAQSVMADLREIYTPDETYAGAFAKWIGTLTDKHGLIVLDPSGREFNAMARPLIEKELFGAQSSGAPIAEATEQLESLGHAPQIKDRGESLNLFFIDDSGARVPLKRESGGGFHTGGKPAFLDEATARQILEDAPERFSPSALLRPVFEDSVLPTIGYVGGPAERKYYAQVGGVYRWAGVPNPEVLQRPSFTVVRQSDMLALTEVSNMSPAEIIASDSVSDVIGTSGLPAGVQQAYAGIFALRKELDALSNTLEERVVQGASRIVIRDVGELTKKFTLAFRQARNALKGHDLERLDRGLTYANERISGALENLKTSVLESDPKQGRSPKRHPFSVIRKRLNGLESQLAKVSRKRSGELVSTVHTLKPTRKPQERQMNIAQLMAQFGPGLVDQLIDSAHTRQSGPELVLVSS